MDELSNIEKVQYYPLDFDSIQKGDAWATDELERLTGKRRDTTEYQFAVMALKSRIYRELKDRGKRVTLAVVKGALRVLTDEEAALYNARTFRQGFRRSVRSFSRMSTVNQAGMTERQKADHERNLIVYGRMLQAARNGKKQALRATAVKRDVPGLPEGSDVKSSS